MEHSASAVIAQDLPPAPSCRDFPFSGRNMPMILTLAWAIRWTGATPRPFPRLAR